MPRFKAYPPGLGQVSVPVDSGAAALAGLALYTPCRGRALWLHRRMLELTRRYGPRALPAAVRAWSPPMPGEEWEALKEGWRGRAGEFDSYAVYERSQAERTGFAVLLIRGSRPIAFVRLLRGDPGRLRKEYRILESVACHGPASFRAPVPLAVETVSSGWGALLTTAFSGPHHVPRAAPARLIGREITAALSGLPRAPATSAGWEPMHGDLTPWNLREREDGSLCLLDWEEAAWGPPGADAVLYEATACALRRRSPGWTAPRETIDFWRGRLAARVRGAERDRRLGEAVDRCLRAMRAGPTPRVAGRRPRALVFAYACDPASGSEPGAGWGVVRAVERLADCVVLVGPEHTASLARWRRRHPGSRIEFVTVDEPGWAGRAKVHRITWFLLYLAWLRRAARRARVLLRAGGYDVAVHATYSVYWLPSPIRSLGLPYVLGPVGGAVGTPPRLWPALGWRGAFDEALDRVAVRFAAALPATRRTLGEASTVLAQNRATLDRLPPAVKSRAIEVSHVELGEPPVPRPLVGAPSSPFVLCVGALEPRKGLALALRAMRHVPGIPLVVAGEGPDRARLERLSRRLGLEDRVRFVGRVERAALFALIDEARAGLVTWLREEGGMALGELMQRGLPVAVLGHGGPARVLDACADPGRVRWVSPAGLDDTARRLGTALRSLLERPAGSRRPSLDSAPGQAALARAVGLATAVPATDVRPSRRSAPAPGRPRSRRGDSRGNTPSRDGTSRGFRGAAPTPDA